MKTKLVELDNLTYRSLTPFHKPSSCFLFFFKKKTSYISKQAPLIHQAPHTPQTNKADDHLLGPFLLTFLWLHHLSSFFLFLPPHSLASYKPVMMYDKVMTPFFRLYNHTHHELDSTFILDNLFQHLQIHPFFLTSFSSCIPGGCCCCLFWFRPLIWFDCITISIIRALSLHLSNLLVSSSASDVMSLSLIDLTFLDTSLVSLSLSSSLSSTVLS